MSSSFTSVFEREFDVVVHGAGLIGYAAARCLSAAGKRVLLLEGSADILWELTRALEDGLAAQASPPEWARWVDHLKACGGVRDGCVDPVLAEVLTARDLQEGKGQGGPELLLYASPVAVERTENTLTAVELATKAGVRRLRARQWIDASEKGSLAKLCDPYLRERQPSVTRRSLLLQSLSASRLDGLAEKLARLRPGTRLLPAFREEARRLSWESRGEPWHKVVVELIGALREWTAAESAEIGAVAVDARAWGAAVDRDASTDFVMSHVAARDFPLYETSAPAAPEAALPVNLLPASPALRGEAIVSLGDRFQLGHALAAELLENDAGMPRRVVRPAQKAAAPALLKAAKGGPDVLVVGGGTAGAVAAIAAARQGARTQVLESSAFPGGVGTAGMICGYFHGAKGGLQAQLDARTERLNALLAGRTYGGSWHHDAKKIAILEWFDELGITFTENAFVYGVERAVASDKQGCAVIKAVRAVVDGAPLRLAARAFIDSTGDGDVCVLAGAGFAEGRPGDGRTLSYSQSVLRLVAGPASGAADGVRALKVQGSNFDAGWVDATDSEDLTRARLAGLGQYLRRKWPVEERPVAIAPLLGIRQSRHILTDESVTMADLVGQARFGDSIGEAETVADTHSVDFEFEEDEMAFYYWTCRGFRHKLRSELPYRMLLPQGLANVWIACRASGVAVSAAYGLRMESDMQRLGEAAGCAAALAAAADAGERSVNSRRIDLGALQRELEKTGARPVRRLEAPDFDLDACLARLDEGKPGVAFWHLFKERDAAEAAVRERLDGAAVAQAASFYAAVILAMWGESCAETRLLRALSERETGPSSESPRVLGAFGQCVDLPFWLQAVVFLRKIGTPRILAEFRSLAEEERLPLNVRTQLALTLERLAGRSKEAAGEIMAVLKLLLTDDIPDAELPPSRSLWRALQGEPQKALGHDYGADTKQDHRWQLELIAARTRRALGQGSQTQAAEAARRQDPRGFVRKMFLVHCG